MHGEGFKMCTWFLPAKPRTKSSVPTANYNQISIFAAPGRPTGWPEGNIASHRGDGGGSTVGDRTIVRLR